MKDPRHKNFLKRVNDCTSLPQLRELSKHFILNLLCRESYQSFLERCRLIEARSPFESSEYFEELIQDVDDLIQEIKNGERQQNIFNKKKEKEIKEVNHKKKFNIECLSGKLYTLNEIKVDVFADRLDHFDCNFKRTAKSLDISVKTLRKYIQRYNLLKKVKYLE